MIGSGLLNDTNYAIENVPLFIIQMCGHIPFNQSCERKSSLLSAFQINNNNLKKKKKKEEKKKKRVKLNNLT